MRLVGLHTQDRSKQKQQEKLERRWKTLYWYESGELFKFNSFQGMQYPPSVFVSDAGGEFDLRNNDFSAVVERLHLSVYYGKGKTKNAIAERWNRTFKTRLQRYFTDKKTTKWIDVLENFTNNINRSYNRSIGMAPSEVTFENSQNILKRLHPNSKRPKMCKLRVGDLVRIPATETIFSKVSNHKFY